MKRFTLLCFFISFLTFKHFGQSEFNLVLVQDGFDEPVDISSAGDERLFIVEKRGVIKILLKDGTVMDTPFLDVQNKIANSGGERGLLGLVFHPNFTENGYFYINYTDDNNDTQVSRFSVTSDPNIADSNSEFDIINIDQPVGNHNGGDLSFGPDGYLYIATGDGGGAGDPSNFSQNPQSLLGKMLRIDVNTNNSINYFIPTDNPFINDDSVLDEIWSTGLRNPWRYSFDRETGDLWIGDVGQGAFEEIHLRPANSQGGENYGWRCYEGNATFSFGGCSNNIEDYVFPVDAYPHQNNGCSVTGGFVYRGKTYVDLIGKYIYGDYCSGRIWTLTQVDDDNWTRTEVFQGATSSWSSFGEDENGELYAASLRGGVYQITTPNVVSIDIENQLGSIEVLENPFDDELNITIQSKKVVRGSLYLSNANGQELFRTAIDLRSNNRINIPTTQLASGFYYLVMEVDNKQIVKKILKQ